MKTLSITPCIIRCILFFTGIMFIGANCQATKLISTQTSESENSGSPQPHVADSESYLFFDVSYVYRPGCKGEFIPLTNNKVLHSGECYKIIFTPEQDNYVYIFQIDSAEKIYRLFPMESFGGVTVNNFNPVKGGKTYYIPAEDKSFVLDEQMGTETIYFLASHQRDDALEELSQENEQKDELAIIDQLLQLAEEAKDGPALVSDPAETEKFSWQEEGQTFSVLQQRLENMCDGCVFVLTFEHR